MQRRQPESAPSPAPQEALPAVIEAEAATPPSPRARRHAARRSLRYDPTDTMLTFMLVNLSGFALIGKSYAYIGVPPLFINEITIVLGLGLIVLFRPLVGLLRMPGLFPLLIWIGSGIVVLIAQEDQGIDINALRDSVIWMYAIIAIVFFMMFYRNAERVQRMLRWYRWHITWTPMIATALYNINRFIEVPSAPWAFGADLQMVAKQSDISIQAGGAMVAILCGVVRPPAWVMLASFICWLLVATAGRAGLFNTLLALMICFALMRRRFSLGKPVMLALVFIAILTPLSFMIPEASGGLNSGRKVNAAQIVENFASVFGGSDNSQLSDTNNFRKLWWASVLEHSINSERNWLMGLGFGFSLAELAPFEVEKDVRSPHNFFVTVAGRMGVVGLSALGFMIASWLFMMMRVYFRAKANGERMIEGMAVWLIAMFVAMLFNGATDVALEGPVSAAWFWSVYGLGSVVATLREKPDPAAAPRVRRRRPSAPAV